jgi:predicted acetyltransferase
VRVGLGVPVAGKMLAARGDTRVPEPCRERDAELGHDGRIGAEGAQADDGIVRIRVDVEDWGEIEVHTDGEKLTPDEPPVVPSEERIPERAERAKGGERCESFAQTRDLAALLVNADEERPSGPSFQRSCELEHFARAADVARKQNDAPHTAGEQALEIRRERLAVETHGKEARRRRFEIHRAEHSVDHRAGHGSRAPFCYDAAVVAGTDFVTLEPSRDLDAFASIVGWAFGFAAPDARRWLERGGLQHARVARRGGRVIGGLLEIPMGQFYGGRSVSNLGIAGVAVAPEARGGRVALELVLSSLRAARSAGMAVSTLYPATHTLYRAAGYELAGSRFRWTLAARKLPRERTSLVVAPVETEDLHEVEALYRRSSSRRPGYLDRGDYVWRRVREAKGSEVHGYVVRGEDGVEGYVYLGQRGPEDRRELVITDLAAATAPALRRLFRLVADHQSTLTSAVMHGGPTDPLLFALPEAAGEVVLAEAWMLRVVDVERALTDRGYPALDARIDFELADEHLPENAGRIRLEVEAGRASVTRGGTGAVRLSERGLAALYTGFQSATELARAGLLAADDASLSTLNDLFSGPTPAMADYF